MEPLIIIVALAIIGYVIYINLSSSKFIKADKLMDAGKFDEASALFKKLIPRKSLALSRYAECFFKKGYGFQEKQELGTAKKYFEKVIEAKEQASPLSDLANYEVIEARAHFELATIFFFEIKRKNNLDSIKEYKKNLSYLQKIKDKIEENKFNDIALKHNHIISEIYFAIGLTQEKSNDVIDAIRNYGNAISFIVDLPQDPVFLNSQARLFICKVKHGETVHVEDFKKYSAIPEPVKADFYFRYTVQLIQQNKFTEAEKILCDYLNIVSEDVDKLWKICNAEKIKYVIQEISIINDRLLKLYETENSSNDILETYSYISSSGKEIVKIIPELKPTLKEIIPSLFNRVLTEFHENKQYEEIIELITKYPEFYNSPALLKNLGNVCIKLIDEGFMTDQNYKMLICLFLTSTYNDSVMLYSLKETVWDDEYTFSLSDSVGPKFKDWSDLPENVNFDEISETNVSIGESQRFLLNQFECLINEKIVETELLKKVHTFYNSEKNVLDQLVGYIEKEMVISSPYFAQTYYMQDDILSEIEDFYLESGDEEALEIGEYYNTKKSNSTITNFTEAKVNFTKLITSIKGGDHEKIRSALSNLDLTLIIEYDTISEKIEGELVQAFKHVIEHDDENEELLQIFQATIKISPTKEKLKYQYANYAADLCVSKINADRMSNYKGLQIMLDAYKSMPFDNRVCRNIIILIRMNIMDILNDRSNYNSEIFNILDEIKKNRSKTFKNNSGELKKALKDILSQLSPEVIGTISRGTNLSSHGWNLKKGIDYLSVLSNME